MSIEQSYAQLLESEREQGVLVETVTAVTSMKRYTAVLDQILSQVQRIIPCQAAAIAVLDEMGRFQIAHSCGYEQFCSQRFIANMPHAISELPVDMAAIHLGQPQLVVNAPQPDLPDYFVDATIWIRSSLLVPIRLHDKTLGLLRLDDPNSNQFSPGDVERIEPIANAIAIAIENARMYAQAQQEIAERKRVEAALRQSEMRYRYLSDLTTDFAYVLKVDDDQTIHVEWVTDAFFQVTGYESDECQDVWLTIFHPDDSHIIRQRAEAIYNGQTHNCQFRIIMKGGETRWLRDFVRSSLQDEEGSATAYVYGAVKDITEYKRVAAAMERTQKLESMGVIASGIAHDFNNILSAVMAQSALALLSLSDLHRAHESIEKIMSIAEDGSELTQQLLTYAGGGKFQLQALDVGQIIENSHALLEGIIPKTVSLQMHIAPNLPQILADRSQVQQILMNLVINAAEAYESQPGLVTIGVDVKEMMAEDWYNYDPLMPPGNYIYLEVADKGQGMDEETAKRMFDPFFTTKLSGRGLGMASVQGIVHAYHGLVSFDTAVGRGTVFSIFLPVSASVQPKRVDKTTSLDLAAHPVTGSILLIDDEVVIRTAVAQYLELSGFTVLTAEDGRNGLDTFMAQQEQISLVLLDVTMPVMTGNEALMQIRRLSPTVPVIMLSGLNEDGIAASIDNYDNVRFVPKPFRLQDLLQMIKALFGQ